MRVLRLDLGFPNGTVLAPAPQDVGDTPGAPATSCVGSGGLRDAGRCPGQCPQALSLSSRGSDLAYGRAAPLSACLQPHSQPSVCKRPPVPARAASLLAAGDSSPAPRGGWLVSRAGAGPLLMSACVFPATTVSLAAVHTFPSVCLSACLPRHTDFSRTAL